VVVALAIPQHSVHFLVVIWANPRTIVVVQLERRKQEAVPDSRGRSREQSPPTVVARADGHSGTIEPIDVVDVGRASSREIAFVGEVRPLLVLNSADEFRNEKLRSAYPCACAPVGVFTGTPTTVVEKSVP